MFSGNGDLHAAGTPLPPALSLDNLQDALARLSLHDGAGLSEAELVDHIHALEQLKSGLAAAQARLTATFVARRSAREAADGVPADRRCRGLAAEIALARQESPVSGARSLGLAKALVHEMPHTLSALTRGEISEWRATLVVRETAALSRADRARVDAELAGRLAGAGDRQVAAAARKIGYRLDPGSAIRRVRGASADRHVGLRPAPDTMTYLTGFLPVAQGVACQVALSREADALRAAGDRRSRGQIMADTLVARVTGRERAVGIPVEIHLVMTDTTLLAGDQSPAHVSGYGDVPAAVARQLTREADRAWVRRLYTSPATGSLVAMDSRRRAFEGELRQFVVLRDQICRTAWCDAPIRHIDHVVRASEGGPTSADNGQGLCEACNQAKESHGWRAQRLADQGHAVRTITPTGHDYTTEPPDPPGRQGGRRYRSPLEVRLASLVAA